jgi:predicted nucleotidyltransferase
MSNPRIAIPKEKIVRFCQKNHIAKMSLFGSVLTDQFNAGSDVDFLVEFQSSHIPTLFDMVNMEDELSVIIGRHADLRTKKGISRYFRDDVVSGALRIYG